jgi:hypothetical protein
LWEDATLTTEGQHHMLARKSKEWLDGDTAQTPAALAATADVSAVGSCPTAEATTLERHIATLKSLKADFENLRYLSVTGATLKHEMEQIAEAVDPVADHLLAGLSETEIELVNLTARRANVEAQLANLTKKEHTAQAALQKRLATDFVAADRLYNAWFAHCLERETAKLLDTLELSKRQILSCKRCAAA